MEKSIILRGIYAFILCCLSLQANVSPSQDLELQGEEFSEDWTEENEINLRRKFRRHHCHRDDNTMANVDAFGTASFSPTVSLPLLSSAQVVFTQIAAQTSNVILTPDGGLRIPKGDYQLTYGANFENRGLTDEISLWLTCQTHSRHKKRIEVVPFSLRKENILPVLPSQNFSTVRTIGQLLFTAHETVTLYVNYSTNGTSQLFTFPLNPNFGVPHAFFLMVRQLGNDSVQ